MSSHFGHICLRGSDDGVDITHVAMNRFRAAAGRETEFETVWKSRLEGA
jgi:hypothetical protein